MPTTIRRLTGFSGHAFIDGTQVLITSGNMNEEITPSYVNFIDIAPDTTQRSKVLYAPGTKIITGSVGFDVTADFLEVLSADRLFQRNYSFTTQIFDGNQGKQATNCKVTSLSLSGSVGGLISGSLSFISKDFDEDGLIQAYNPSGTFYLPPATTLPLGYWYSGRSDLQVREWSLGFNQAVTPVFLNQVSDPDRTVPRYFKVGVIDSTLSLTTYDDPTTLGSPPSSISVGTSTFSLTGVKTSTGYNFSPTEMGTFSHDFATAAVTLPNETVFAVS